ncbi:MCP methyltransferase, CheR-type [Abditibacterium utsteinense]|uniref:MCP methyltransferase, CheR-type n=1 Tax=Abditibacterium utsteinense TaxID=1960156 RepID=A0A2S8STT4_9BACT|nr:protein-glutamate O-methyltransferase CheR [Abditibacterium utsteinense]PQV64214.1 MCP methyltransferase, CheR-type [Abditibacterium utsteinense]
MTPPTSAGSSISISAATLTQFSHHIAAQLGWDYPPERHADLRRGLEDALRELGFSDLESGARALLKTSFSPRQIEVLAAHLTIGETYFWREPRALEAFAAQILPQIMARSSGAPVRIWSAGCASGEEAYTLSMLLCEQLSKTQRAQVSVLASDINPIFLKKARAGIYSNWSFRTLPDSLKARYFIHRSNENRSNENRSNENRSNENRSDEKWEVAPELRAMTHFSALNLVAATLPSPFDALQFAAIFCRNVLIYFDDTQISRILARFENALLPDGWLVVGPSETARVSLGNFTRTSFPGATLFQKSRFRPDQAAGANISASEVARGVAPKATAKTAQFSLAVAQSASAQRATVSIATSFPAISLMAGPALLPAPTLEAVRHAADAGALDAALEGVEKLLSEDKLAAPLHFLRATILHGRGENERALRALQRATFLDGDFVLAYFFMGNIARETGNSELARRSLETARTLLSRLKRDDIVAESDDMTAGQLAGAVEIALKSQLPKGKS